MKKPAHLKFKLTYEGRVIGDVLAPVEMSDYKHETSEVFHVSMLPVMSVVIHGVTLRAGAISSSESSDGLTLHLTDMSIADTHLAHESLKSLNANLVRSGCSINSWVTENEEMHLQERIIKDRNTDELLERGKVNFLRKWDIKRGAICSLIGALTGGIASGYAIDASIGLGVFNFVLATGVITTLGQNYFVAEYAENHNANLIE